MHPKIFVSTLQINYVAHYLHQKVMTTIKLNIKAEMCVVSVCVCVCVWGGGGGGGGGGGRGRQSK